MLDWNTPKLSDKEWIEQCVKESQYIGSDAAFANIFLLRSKYNIKVTYYKDLLIRYYERIHLQAGQRVRQMQAIMITYMDSQNFHCLAEEYIIRRRTTFPNLKGHMRIICSVK